MWEGSKLYPEQIRVPSWRQLNGDKRADPRGRVPGDVATFEQYPLDQLPIPNLSPAQIESFFKKIDRKGDDDCWEWNSYTRGGYGRVRIGGTLYGATRMLWRLVHGSDPIGQYICHKCDNPGCCNPSHLFLGSAADNNDDKEKKGRGKHPIGEAAGLAKLTEEDVIRIFTSAESATVLGRQYGVASTAIDSIRKGRSWGHVTSQLPISDVFNFPRVTGNSKQRRAWFPTQLHEGLVERCVLMSSLAGERVCDCMSGSSTTAIVCKRLGRPCDSIEIDPVTCERIAELLECRSLVKTGVV
jgi:hypothetical protein